MQLGQLGFNAFPYLRRFYITAINLQSVVEVLNNAVVVHDVTCVLAREGSVHASDSLQQRVLFERLVEVHSADNGRVPACEQHVRNNNQAHVICMGLPIQPFAFIPVRHRKKLTDKGADLIGGQGDWDFTRFYLRFDPLLNGLHFFSRNPVLGSLFHHRNPRSRGRDTGQGNNHSAFKGR